MAEKAEVGMDNKEDMEAEINSFPPKSPLTDAEAMEERDLKYGNGGGVLLGEKEEDLPSPPQSKEADNDIQSEDSYAPPLDQATTYLPPLQDESEQGGLVAVEDAPMDTEPKVEGLDEMRQGEAEQESDVKAFTEMKQEPKVEGLDEMRQGEAEQEPDVRALTQMEQEPDVEAPDDAELNASDPLETKPEGQDLVAIQLEQPALDEFEADQQVADALESSGSRSDLHVDDADEGFIVFELDKMDSSVPEEGNIEEPENQLVDYATELSCMTEEPQEQLADDAAGPFCTEGEPQEQRIDADVGGTAVNEKLSSEDAGAGTNDVQQGELQLVDTATVVSEVNPAVSEEQFQEGSAEPPVSEEFNEQLDHETPIDSVFDEPPSTPVSDEAVLIKEPSLSTPAMEALIDVDDEEPLYKQESHEILEDSEQCLDAEETPEESAGGDGQCAAEGISNLLELEVDNNEQERAENNAFDEDVPLAAAADNACEGLVSSGQELRTNAPSADEPDGKEELANEAPFVFKEDLDTEQGPINEEPSMEPHSEQELDIEVPNAVEREPLAQSLGTVPSSSELAMAAETHEKGDEAAALVAEEGNIDEQELGCDAPVIKQARDVKGDVAAVSVLVEEDAVTNNPDESTTEKEPSGWALSSDQGFNNPDKKEKPLLEASDGHESCPNNQSGTEGLTAEQDKSSVQISDEVDLAFAPEGETGSSKADVKFEASNGQLHEDDPNRKMQDEKPSVNMIPCSDNLMEAHHIDENCDRSSSLSEPSSETEQDEQVICVSAHMLNSGDFLQSFPSIDNGGKAEGTYAVLSTVPILEFEKVSDGTSKLEPMENGLAYTRTTPENDKQGILEAHIPGSKDETNEVKDVGTQAVKAEDRDLNAGEEREVVGGAKGIAADMDATGISKSLVLENGLLKHNEGDLVKESVGEEYMNGTAITDMTVENAEVFHNETSREASLSLVVPQQRDMNQRTSENVRQRDVEHMNGNMTVARRTNWWGCCGMLDLLLRKD